MSYEEIAFLLNQISGMSNKLFVIPKIGLLAIANPLRQLVLKYVILSSKSPDSQLPAKSIEKMSIGIKFRLGLVTLEEV